MRLCLRLSPQAWSHRAWPGGGCCGCTSPKAPEQGCLGQNRAEAHPTSAPCPPPLAAFCIDPQIELFPPSLGSGSALGGSTPASGVRWVSAQHTFLKASLKSHPPPSPSPSFHPPLSPNPVLHKESGPGGACPAMWGLSTEALRLSVGGEGRGPCPGFQPTPALPYLPGTLW